MADQCLEARSSPVQAPVAPRWEWRTFGRRFVRAEARLRDLTPSPCLESDEIYFLSTRCENVKVRDGLMDIKLLRAVSPEGLEQWEPVMKAAFPLSAGEAAKVLGALGLSPEGSLRQGCSLERLVEACASPESGIRLVEVRKRRVRYTVRGCMAELTDIEANGLATRTIAVESEHPAAVLGAVEWLGLAGYANTGYMRGLAELIDHRPELYAVIDVGTNSVKFHLGERLPNGEWKTITDRAELTRLGEGLAQSGRIGDGALERTAEAISAMAGEAKRDGARALAAVGTAGLRIARNAADIVAAIRERTGIGIEIISGEEEARLAYLATVAALGPTAGTLVVFDSGGGSSQFSFGHGGRVDERFSVDVGAARYTERFHLDRAVPESVVEAALAAIAQDLAQLDGRQPPQALVGMGGAVTNIAAVSLGLAVYDPARIQGAIVTGEEIDRQIALYRSLDAEARRTIVGLQPKRAEVILAGACIARIVLRKLGKYALTVSDRGLRHGLLAERFGGRESEADAMPGARCTENSGKPA